MARLAGWLRGREPSCGPVRVIGVDGHAGSGKSTLAGLLADALDGAPVLHLDDLASHDAPFGWTRRLTTDVLTPLSHGETARFPGYDWERRAFHRPLEVPPAPVLLVEGVGAGRRALRPALSAVLWLDVPAAVAWPRGRRRDGPALAAFWDGWTVAESAHFASDPTRPHADALVRPCENGFPGCVCYEVLEGPEGH
ncbi:hypothetical protein JJV70_16130 [Streptomyces sp. JJ66]|uniref:uridine kinase family protein n=1 Tax=Streptomyces sp. JJ66 TaxID=2803843 RepID=UPI001C57D0F1|nr:hypothetical protein [Streptomyces sp. JJ66]MBW1603605.1 hypothetical protein [Streptomyces sp. JJ66]